MDVLNPSVPGSTAVKPLAPRRRHLRGARIGILDNSKPNAGVLMRRVAELLAERAGAASIAVWQKPGASRPAQIIDAVAAGADVVLTGSAD